MARNRMIKVDFWSDEKVGKMSIMARLMFIGIWNFCDDSGVCRANPAFIRSHIFQHDDVTLKEIAECIKEMAQQKLITLAEYSGESFLLVNNFLRHQTINRPSTFRFISESDDKVMELFISLSTHGGLTEYSLTKVKEKVKEKVKGKVKGKVKVNVKDSTDLDLDASHKNTEPENTTPCVIPSPLKALFPDDLEIQKWLETGSNKIHTRIFEIYDEKFLVDEIEKAYYWQLENKKRKAGSFLQLWLDRSGSKKLKSDAERELDLAAKRFIDTYFPGAILA
jgi:hypothetical protein